MKIRTGSVWATISFAGFHRWPEAVNHRAYLRNLHRHIFEVRGEVSVDHTERQVEFHDLKDALQAAIQRNFPNSVATETMSCETMAHIILEYLMGRWSQLDWYEVTVSEDGENGATVRARSDG